MRLWKPVVNMKKSLFDYLLEKKKSKTINADEEKVLQLYLQIYLLNQYFNIAANYCKTEKIQKEVEELYPAWTGYENYYWYTYHYEAFGNALYSYSQMYKSILNLLSRKITNFPKDGSVLLEEFLADKAINKILQDRHDSVHQFGQWRSDLSEELALQNWQAAEKKIKVPLVEADEKIKIFDAKIISFINTQLQSQT